MTLIEVNKKWRTVPTEWNELSGAQLVQVMETLFVKEYTGEQCLLKLVKILADLNYFQYFRSKPDELSEYFYLTKFILEGKPTMTRNVLPEYKGMHGPADEFNNLIMKELAICDALFMQWNEDREKIALLNELCALLYRPAKKDYDFKKDPDGDAREAFNQNLCSWRAKHIISKWPIGVKMGIATWFDSCRWKLVDDNDEVFGGDAGAEVSKYGLVSVMLSVAETGTLGDFTKVEEHYVHTVMIQLNESIRKAKEYEKQMKAAR